MEVASYARQLGPHGPASSEPCEGDCAIDLRNGKIVLLCLIGFVTFLASTAPWIMKRCFKQRAMDVINATSALAAGIVFGAFLSHMIPDSNAAFEEYLAHAYEDDPDNPLAYYPWSSMLIGVVLIMLIAVDRVIISHGMEGDEDHHSHDHVSQAFLQMQAADNAMTGGPRDAVTAVMLTPGNEEGAHKSASAESTDDDAAIVAVQAPSGTGVASAAASATAAGPSKAAQANASVAVVVPSSHEHAHGHTHASHGHAHKEAVLRAWVFFFALSLHAVFDGLSLGSETTFQGFYGILAAVVSHKVFDGVALGIPVYLADMKPLHSLFALVFCAAMTPLGIAIGLIATELASGEQAMLAEAIIISLSAGSFLFISLVELLPASLHDGRYVKSKMGAFVLGWLAMVILAGFV